MILEEKIARLLKKKHQTVSVAESCSGGLLGHQLTNLPGSSKYFYGGVIVYSNAAKVKTLGVSADIIKKQGAVSAPVAQKMAEAVRKLFKTDFGISITGIAGPSGGTKDKPIGLTFIAVAKQKKILCRQFRFKGTRLNIKTLAVHSALRFLLEMI